MVQCSLMQVDVYKYKDQNINLQYVQEVTVGA